MNPYVTAAMITAIPATLAASANWYATHKNRAEIHSDSAKILKAIEKHDVRFDQIDLHFERTDTQFEKQDLRLDSIEDKVERHLGWHRAGAERDLELLLKKEAPNERNL